MNRNQLIILYLIIFIFFAIALKYFGLAQYDNLELLAVIFVAYGSGTVYNTIGQNKKFSLFVGTSAFLSGIVFFLIGKQQIFNSSGILFPSILFILGIGCLMLFFDNTADKSLLIIAAVFMVLGIIYTGVSGSFNTATFLNSLYELAQEYWLIILVVIIAIYLVSRGRKKQI